MKISVITASFNNADTIADTIRSVIAQDYAEIEYIIIDGNSTDDTLKIIEEFKTNISKIISEKDNGIYFALNKGIELATGDVIAFLHADDIFADPEVLSKVMQLFREKNVESVYGDLHYVDRIDTKKIIRNWRSGEYSHGLFLKGWMPPHPSFFLRKEIYKKFGTFNTSFRSAADYELMLRMLHKNKISTAYLPEVIVKMRVGGVSNASMKNRVKANREDKRAWEVNGLKPGLLTFIRKPLSKIKQYFS
ncbi:MAG: glycosyltransferase [Bacteroidota bacterium]|nr:glycosyltransferase [Bacteroidota bacterium]